MAKKLPIKEKFIVLSFEEKYEGSFDTLDGAQDMISDTEMNGAKILKVVQVWESHYPEEPEMEFWDSSLENL